MLAVVAEGRNPAGGDTAIDGASKGKPVVCDLNSEKIGELVHTALPVVLIPLRNAIRAQLDDRQHRKVSKRWTAVWRAQRVSLLAALVLQKTV